MALSIVKDNCRHSVVTCSEDETREAYRHTLWPNKGYEKCPLCGEIWVIEQSYGAHLSRIVSLTNLDSSHESWPYYPVCTWAQRDRKAGVTEREQEERAEQRRKTQKIMSQGCATGGDAYDRWPTTAREVGDNDGPVYPGVVRGWPKRSWHGQGGPGYGG